MNTTVKFPLMAKVAAMLFAYLLTLALAFYLFVNWQLHLGLNSLLSGATGDRLESLGNVISSDLQDAPRERWQELVDQRVAHYGIEGVLVSPDSLGPDRQREDIPESLLERLREVRPPMPERPRMGKGPPEMTADRRPPVPDSPKKEGVDALFLMQAGEDGSYWAVLEMRGDDGDHPRDRHLLLFLRSETASANGLFFDYQPWLLGGLAVLALSLLMWAPFVLGITHYARRISRTTRRIAAGEFDAKIGSARRDELGQAGESIETMATKIGELVSGQKRFLGDVAHELCAPLARLRTGLGILETKVGAEYSERIESVDEDAAELSMLVEELLAFTKANSSNIAMEQIELHPLIGTLLERELVGHKVEVDVVPGLSVQADRRLLTRALLNVFRNCHLHAGADSGIWVSATAAGERVTIRVEDDGPGVVKEEFGRLFEPFYRVDLSRARSTGGTGLGMAIVESSITACGGTVAAEASERGGLAVVIRL